jgi:hypothetical protein
MSGSSRLTVSVHSPLYSEWVGLELVAVRTGGLQQPVVPSGRHVSQEHKPPSQNKQATTLASVVNVEAKEESLRTACRFNPQ